jgi:hypothetical protein
MTGARDARGADRPDGYWHVAASQPPIETDWGHEGIVKPPLDAADQDRVRALARQIVGLSQAEAAEQVRREPGLIVQFADASLPITAEGTYGRVTAWVSDGIVIAAEPT